ncbi:hypothetical protein PsorP6_001413 [Peronosclerospora sorghi]|uniref:Uncharacterized protein n=1 Tax=Peronosclerospora sorghi TaxID=230839 RepID=A0ACC0WSR7_9STRA|nr:hypothetical protein PsorP6_001413 [Peronosclerospora sorghi]
MTKGQTSHLLMVFGMGWDRGGFLGKFGFWVGSWVGGTDPRPDPESFGSQHGDPTRPIGTVLLAKPLYACSFLLRPPPFVSLPCKALAESYQINTLRFPESSLRSHTSRGGTSRSKSPYIYRIQCRWAHEMDSRDSTDRLPTWKSLSPTAAAYASISAVARGLTSVCVCMCTGDAHPSLVSPIMTSSCSAAIASDVASMESLNCSSLFSSALYREDWSIRNGRLCLPLHRTLRSRRAIFCRYFCAWVIVWRAVRVPT